MDAPTPSKPLGPRESRFGKPPMSVWLILLRVRRRYILQCQYRLKARTTYTEFCLLSCGAAQWLKWKIRGGEMCIQVWTPVCGCGLLAFCVKEAGIQRHIFYFTLVVSRLAKCMNLPFDGQLNVLQSWLICVCVFGIYEVGNALS